MSRFTLFLLLLPALCLLACAKDSAEMVNLTCDKDEIHSPKLISVAEAKELIYTSDSYIPVEVSKKNEFENGHLKGAVNVWRPDFRSKTFKDYKGMICSASELNNFLQNIGMTDNSTLLLYDNKGACDAMRLAWVFDFYGFQKYKIINGGKTAWNLRNYPLEKSTKAVKKDENFVLKTRVDSTCFATMQDVLAAIKDTNTLVIDTREPYEFLGQAFLAKDKILEYKKGAFARGCIPTAIHLNWSDFSDLAGDHRIKCKKDLLYDLEQKNITKEKNIIVYCQSGSRSSHTAFILREILGFEEVKNYDGSWIEWSYHHTLHGSPPIELHTSEKEFIELKSNLEKEFKQESD